MILRTVIAVGIGLTAASGWADDFTVRTLNPNGAWCWFQDERAVMLNNAVVFGSITSSGTVEITSHNLNTGEQEVVALRENFDVDDHNVPGILRRDDGHLQAFYCRHGRDKKMFVSRTETPGDATRWAEAQEFDFGIPKEQKYGFTYANPFQLSQEKGRIYLFWRAIDFNPTYTYSDDDGTSWSTAQNWIYFKNGQRPYVKYCGNGFDTVHFAYTDAHPRNFDNNIYYASYRGGDFRRAGGDVIHPIADGPIQVEEGTKVYSADQAGKAWIWDMALDRAENPVLVYATVPTRDNHRYRYARWNDETKAWSEREIAHAGHGLYEQEREYSGGICLDPENPSIVYISANVDPVSGERVGTGRYEIYRGDSPDRGVTWKWTAMTKDSQQDNLRPIVPEKHPGGTFVLWMRGRYTKYTDYNTEIVLAH